MINRSPISSQPPASPFVELHAHSFYSLLDGSSSPEALVAQANVLGMTALALTDHDTLAGAMSFRVAAQEAGIKPIFGAEISLAQVSGEETPDPAIELAHLTLIAETQEGYANLCRLITRARCDAVRQHRAASGEWWGKVPPRTTLDVLAEHNRGLIALSGCRQSWVAQALRRGDEAAATYSANVLREIFGLHQVYIELQHHHRAGDDALVQDLAALAQQLRLPVVATGNTHYATHTQARLRDCFIAIDHNLSLTEARRQGLLPLNHSYALPSAADMARRFAAWPHALANTLAIAERCWVDLDFGTHRLPTFAVPENHTEFSYLYELCHRALPMRYPKLEPRVLKQLTHELAVIEEAGLASFFHIVADLVTFARAKGIRCQGRGSAAGSLVAYLLGISSVCPFEHQLLFERFLSPDRHTQPDIDIDFAHDDAGTEAAGTEAAGPNEVVRGREAVLQYAYQKYGPSHCAMVANHVTYRARSAIRDLGKVLGFAEPVVERILGQVDAHEPAIAADQIEQWAATFATASSDAAPTRANIDPQPLLTLASLLRQMDGVVRHLSIHSGGLVITGPPLDEIVPIQPATMPGRYVIEWDKDSAEDAGLIKIDCLSLRTLGMITEAQQLIAARHHQAIDLDTLRLDDPAIYDMLARADCIGTFQVESRAQLQMLPRTKPANILDLAVEIAIIRPGPVQGGAVHPYLRRRAGEELVSYPHPLLEPILKSTLGVLLFQEDCLRIAMTIAGFTAGEADQLRRAMSRSRSKEAMQAMRERFLAGALTNHIAPEVAHDIFDKLAGFASYGFCRSHAASFARISYQTLFLKRYYPAEFYCALLNAQPMGFYSPEVIVGDMRRHGIALLPVDINASQWGYTIDSDDAGHPGLRMGLQAVAGLGAVHWTCIREARAAERFRSLCDFCQRTHLPKPLTSDWIRAGLFDVFGPRRQLLWELGEIMDEPDALGFEVPLSQIVLPDLSELQASIWDYELTGLSPTGQFMQHFRPTLQRAGVLSTAQVKAQPAGRRVRVAGMVAVKQRPQTAKGVTFIGLTDEDGLLDIVVRPELYERYQTVLRGSGFLIVDGVVQRNGDAVSVLAHTVAILKSA